MDRKILLLNSTDEVISFISFKKAVKLFFKGKVEVISYWKNIRIAYGSGSMGFPSIIKLKYYVFKNHKNMRFSRKSVLKRDKYICQYCNKSMSPGQSTVDHVVPRSMGGQSTFTNCVASCYNCNNKKGHKTLEQSNMNLLSKPIIPLEYQFFIPEKDGWHQDWNNYVKKTSNNDNKLSLFLDA